MKLLIEIDEAQKKMVDAIMELPPQVENDLISAIRHGKPLDDVLDKIRAEIREIKPNNPNFKGYFEQNVALNKVLDIIDKYKVEGSENE